MPAPNISIEYLFSRPNPARMPNQIHSLVAGLHDTDKQEGATHPEQRLEGVHGQQVVAGKDTRSGKSAFDRSGQRSLISQGSDGVDGGSAARREVTGQGSGKAEQSCHPNKN